MAELYTLRLVNESPLAGQMCLYQRHPAQESDGSLRSLAWLCQNCRPGGTLTFSWSLEYGLAWAKTGHLQSGLVFEPAQVLPMAPDTPGRQSAILRPAESGYALEAAPEEAGAGSFSVRADAALPGGELAVALTIAGRPVFARPAGPGLTLGFQLQPQYWVAFGPFEAGQALDFDEIVFTSEVRFAPGKRSAQAAFQRDCSWSLR